MQNLFTHFSAETPTIEEQIEVTSDKTEAKHKIIEKSEPQKTQAIAQIQKFEAQKTKPHPILLTSGVKTVSLYTILVQNP